MTTSTDYDQVFGFVSAALISIGGLIGFLKRSSIASLVAGGGSGLLLAYGVNSRDHRVVTGVAGVLFVVMGNRFLRSGAFMPAGLVTLLSTGLLWRFGTKLLA
ncbi:TMEM14 family protein [Sporobolomyces koalae]|uniref:TMEM14 family protein n=1 Tax=Sporobolomyces koalae TaxID=500713 RepID=UPI00317EC5BA